MAKISRLQNPVLKITSINKTYYLFAKKGQEPEFLGEIKKLARILSELDSGEATQEELIGGGLSARQLNEDDLRFPVLNDQGLLGMLLFEAFSIMQCALHNKLTGNSLIN